MEFTGSPQDQKPNKKFLCFGLVMLDILLTGVEKLPEHWEETVFAKEVFRSTGGGASNSAITLGRLGAMVELAGKIGDDDFGSAIADELRKNGVSTEKLLRQAGVPSGVAMGLVNPGGKRCFITARGANNHLDPKEFDISFKGRYDFFFINGFFQFPQAEAALLELSRELSQKGVKIAFDMASWDGSGRWMQAAAPFLPVIDYFFTNSSQLEALTKEREQDSGAAFLIEKGAGKIIVKMGARGCKIYGEETIEVSAPDLPVKDTTGAGDSFDSAWLFAHALGWTDYECGAFGNMVAGINCGSLGATGGVPGYDTALKEMARHYPLPKGVA